MSKVLLSTERFSVERREFSQPNGKTIKRDIVVHPGAVVVLPFLDDKQIVMIKNYRYTAEKELLELPAGTREENELPMETAKRELEEETGFRAKRFVPLMEFYTSPGILNEQMYVFIAYDLTRGESDLDETEKITVQITQLSEARRMLIEGQLSDGKTIAVLGTYFARVAQGT